MFLKKGDLVDIISPASTISKSELAAIKLFLEKNGLKARFYMEEELALDKKQSHLFSTFSPKTRFEQLKFALENKESKAVWCVRGGYGSGDLLPFLQKTKKITQNKLFIGFSDITSLAIFLQQKWDWKIIYGPMLNQITSDKISKKSQQIILDFVFGKKTQLKYDLEAKNSTKKVEAELVGGCLSVIASHFATSNQIDWKDKILFLEDIDETGEKIDRYFAQIIQIMLQNKSYPKAILLGNFLFGVSLSAKKRNIAFAIEKLTIYLQQNNLKIPVFEEKTHCLGHSQNITPIIIGNFTKIYDNILTQKI